MLTFYQALTRGQKVQSRREREIWNSFLQFGEEKENSEIPFSSFEKGKRNLQKASPLLRREREWHFLFSGFERRKRNFEKNLKFREEKSEIPYPSFEKRKRNLQKRFFSIEKRKRNRYSFLKFIEEIAVCPILHPSSFLWKDGRFFGKSTGKIQVFVILTSFCVIETGKKSQKLREVRYLFLINLVFKNLRNWEEKEKFFSESWKSRRERDLCFWISSIEKRKRIFS